MTTPRETAIRVIAEHVGRSIADIREDIKFADVGADSLDYVEILIEVEEQLAIVILDEEAEKVSSGTIGAFLDVVEKIVARGGV